MKVPSRKVLGVAASLGVVAAATAAGVVAERRIVARRKAADAHPEDFGSLRADPFVVTADDGIALHTEVDEPDDAAAPASDQPTLVFVHGYALNLDCWHFQRAHFRGQRRMVFYDQRSHGRSERSPIGHATIDQLGRDLKRVLDETVPEGPVVLVGHSMGGMTIMALADQHPELFGDRVVGVGLIATTAGGLRSHNVVSPLLPDRVMQHLTPRLMAGLARRPRLVDHARRAGSDVGFLVTSRFAFGQEVPASYVEFVDDRLAQTPFEVLAEFFPNFDALDKFAVLHAFQVVPTVIICGTDDVITSVGHSRKMASLIPDVDLVEVLGAGHMVILERREQVNTALERMLKEADERAGDARQA